MTKYFLPAVVVTFVVAMSLMIHAKSQPARRSSNRAIRSESTTIFAIGRVEGATQEIELRTRLSARADQVLVEEGQTVEKNQLLILLDDQQHRHELALADADLNMAKAQFERLMNGARPEERGEAIALYRAKLMELERARLAWTRIKQLRQADAVSQQEADDQRTLFASVSAEVEAAKARLDKIEAPPRSDDVKIARAHVDAAQARRDLAKSELERTQLRSPISCQILRINVKPGELTGPVSLEPAIILADTSYFRVRAFVEELDAPRVKIGMAATIVADGLPSQKFNGRVIRLSPHMSRKTIWSDRPNERHDTKTREIWVELERSDGLLIGLRVDVMIDARPSRRSLRS